MNPFFTVWDHFKAVDLLALRVHGDKLCIVRLMGSSFIVITYLAELVKKGATQ